MPTSILPRVGLTRQPIVLVLVLVPGTEIFALSLTFFDTSFGSQVFCINGEF